VAPESVTSAPAIDRRLDAVQALAGDEARRAALLAALDGVRDPSDSARRRRAPREPA